VSFKLNQIIKFLKKLIKILKTNLFNQTGKCRMSHIISPSFLVALKATMKKLVFFSIKKITEINKLNKFSFSIKVSESHGLFCFFCCYNCWNACKGVCACFRCCRHGIGCPLYMYCIFVMMFLLMILVFLICFFYGYKYSGPTGKYLLTGG
jgi:hypothetical protein